MQIYIERIHIVNFFTDIVTYFMHSYIYFIFRKFDIYHKVHLCYLNAKWFIILGGGQQISTFLSMRSQSNRIKFWRSNLSLHLNTLDTNLLVYYYSEKMFTLIEAKLKKTDAECSGIEII